MLTSDQVAASVNTNPVVIRRCLGDLRRAGLVSVIRGAGAGWSLARLPGEITLLEVYEAVGPEPPFGLHHAEPNLECPVGRGIRPALSRVYGSVEGPVDRLRLRATARVVQSRWGIKPYRALLGALHLRDTVEIDVEANLKPARAAQLGVVERI